MKSENFSLLGQLHDDLHPLHNFLPESLDSLHGVVCHVHFVGDVPRRLRASAAFRRRLSKLFVRVKQPEILIVHYYTEFSHFV